jgi:hypothetical protein
MRIAGRTLSRAQLLVACGTVLVVTAATVAVVLAFHRGPGLGRTSFSMPNLGAGGSGAAVPGSASGSASASASRSASASPSLPVAAGAAAHGGSGAHLRQVDGGPGYYGKFSNGLPTDPAFFPIAVWYESVLEPASVNTDKAAGLNTYIQLTDDSDLSLVRSAGMHVILDDPSVAHGAETQGWMLSDETDMWGGPGTAPWSGKYPGDGDICVPADAKCGYTVMQTLGGKLPADHRVRYTNYGKGVTFWDSDAEAAKFVNQYQDIVSVDNYWFTDGNICGVQEGGTLFGDKELSATQCRLASNYGRTVDRVRSLVSPAGSKPVWGFVEVGHPGTEGTTVAPAQVAAGVWSSIIHGARGIIYFNHSFGGPCQTQHALREPCYAAVRAVVTTVDSQITALAPVLNAPFADGVVKGSSGVDVSTKWYDGHFYVLAGSNTASAQTASFSLPCVGGASVTVLNEKRTLPVTGGTFSDTFADSNAVHLYRVDGGSSCGAY